MRGRRFLCVLVLIAATFVGAGFTPAFSLPTARIKEPRPPVAGPGADPAAAHAEAIAALARAKRDGDAATAGRIAALLGWRPAPPETPADGPVTVFRADRAPGAEKWGGDIRVNQPMWPSAYPALACRSDGTLFAVVDDLSGNYLDIYQSADGGETWSYDVSLYNAGGDLRYPSITIAEGIRNRLLIAYDALYDDANSRVLVYWRDLDDQSNGAVIVDTLPGVGTFSCPKIRVDSPEYDIWYAYITYGYGMPTGEGCVVRTSRTLTYGESWETSTVFATDVRGLDDHAIDFGAAGLFAACASFTSPTGIRVRRSTDFGGTWGPTANLGSSVLVKWEPSVAVPTVGNTAVVSFAVDYGGGDTDIEAYVTTDAGGTWTSSYLPYTADLEAGSTLATDPLTGTIHAAFTRGHSIVTTQAAYDDPGTWSLVRRVNEEQAATQFLRIAAAVDPSGDRGLGVAWTDERVRDDIAVYFDASASESPRALEYLVICPEALRDAAVHLAHYRELCGFGVDVVTLEQMGPGPPDPALIDAVIEEISVIEPRLRYVALVGAVDLLPGFPISDGTDEWFSDLPYADVDGDYPQNYLPDIAVGRIPVHEPDQLWTYVAKVKDFELTRRFRNRAVFFGDLPEMTYVANRDSTTAAGLGFDVVTLYSPDEGTLLGALNDPTVSMVLYYGHGTFATNWPLHLGNLDFWLNDGRPMLFFSGGCNFNDNTLENAPLGHELLTRPGCAATTIGATINGGYGYAYGYVDAMLSYLWAFKTVGELHRFALSYHVADAAAQGQDVSPGSWVHLFAERMMCHGDPALRFDGDVTAAPDAAPDVRTQVRSCPNPFNPRTSIRFDLPARGAVDLTIYDVRGRVVRVLLDGDMRNAGPQAVPWDGRDDRGRAAPSGTYIARLQAGSFAATSKLALVR